MTRLTELAPETLTPEQKRVRDAIGAARGGRASGPFGVWLRVPGIADGANHLGNALRSNGKLEKRLFELMVLVNVRHWTAHYAWQVHEEAGREAGLAQDIIDAIRDRRPPDFKREDERLIYDTAKELAETRALSDASYERALKGLGLELLIELVAGCGFYTMVAMTLVTFDIPARGGGRLPA
jgi:4-carboxymuconolactone decarboxylase